MGAEAAPAKNPYGSLPSAVPPNARIPDFGKKEPYTGFHPAAYREGSDLGASLSSANTLSLSVMKGAALGARQGILDAYEDLKRGYGGAGGGGFTNAAYHPDEGGAGSGLRGGGGLGGENGLGGKSSIGDKSDPSDTPDKDAGAFKSQSFKEFRDYITGRGAAQSIAGQYAARKGEDQAIVDMVAAHAKKWGIDPSTALEVARKEGGLRDFNKTGDHGTSFNPFQLHYKNNIPGVSKAGMGDQFDKETGLKGRDPKNMEAGIDFAMREASRHGWGQWHGWHGGSRAGIGATPSGAKLGVMTPTGIGREHTNAIAKQAADVGKAAENIKTKIPPAMIGGDDLPPAMPAKAFIMHHTGGRGTIEGLKNTLKQRGLGVEYAEDREGHIRQIGGPGSKDILRGWGAGAGLNNDNTVGMEVIAKDDKDVTPTQVASAMRFIRERYKNTPVYGHGEVNPGHKQATEGKTIVDAIRAERANLAAAAAHVARAAVLRNKPMHRGQHSASAYPGLSGHGPGSHAMAASLVAHEHKINGGANVNIRLAGFPKGTKTSASSHGIFTKVAVNRGRAMANAESG